MINANLCTQFLLLKSIEVVLFHPGMLLKDLKIRCSPLLWLGSEGVLWLPSESVDLGAESDKTTSSESKLQHKNLNPH